MCRLGCWDSIVRSQLDPTRAEDVTSTNRTAAPSVEARGRDDAQGGAGGSGGGGGAS